MSSAKPLKTPSKTTNGSSTPTNEAPSSNAAPSSSGAAASLNPNDITSPHELTAFVESVLEKLETRFDDMSSHILERMNQMSSRVDALETSIQDIINGDISVGPSVPQSPSISSGTVRRSGSS